MGTFYSGVYGQNGCDIMVRFRITIDPLDDSVCERAMFEIDLSKKALCFVYLIRREEMYFWAVMEERFASPQLVSFCKEVCKMLDSFLTSNQS